MTLHRPVCAYWYDPHTITDRIHTTRGALPDGARLYYAIKANSHPTVLTAAAREADGCEVASLGELTRALAAGARAIIASGPAKTDTFLHALIDSPVPTVINVESVWELQRLASLTHRSLTHRTVDVCLRVNRASSALSGTHRMTGAPTPFGVDETHLPDLINAAHAAANITIVGLHLHAVSNNLDAAAHAAFIRDAIDYTDRILPEATFINVGGGLGIDYTGEKTFDIDTFARLVPRDARLVLEVGRFIAADAGHYTAEVIDVKNTHGQWFAILRGGTHHFRLPAAWGYNHPFTVHAVEHWPHALPRPEVTNAPVTVVGELCTPRDVLCREQFVERLRVGDIIVFARTGAYGYEVSHHDFLSHEPPQFFTGNPRLPT